MRGAAACDYLFFLGASWATTKVRPDRYKRFQVNELRFPELWQRTRRSGAHISQGARPFPLDHNHWRKHHCYTHLQSQGPAGE
jgi:hypothetical protein